VLDALQTRLCVRQPNGRASDSSRAGTGDPRGHGAARWRNTNSMFNTLFIASETYFCLLLAFISAKKAETTNVFCTSDL